MNLSLSVDFKGVVAALDDSARRQIPFVASQTLNKIALDVKAQIQRQLPVKFDRPTPFTQRGVFLKAADKGRLVSEVFFPQSQDGLGKNVREYIRPGAEGATSRSQKRSEVLLSRTGYLPRGWVTVPGKYIMNGKLDGYGNMPGSYYKQIINVLQLKKMETRQARNIYTASQKRSTKMGVDAEFFAVSPGSNRLGKGGAWLPPGVYRRTGAGGRTLLQYLKFVRKASYKQRLDLHAEGLTALKASGQKRFDEAVASVVERFKAH